MKVKCLTDTNRNGFTKINIIDGNFIDEFNVTRGVATGFTNVEARRNMEKLIKKYDKDSEMEDTQLA